MGLILEQCTNQLKQFIENSCINSYQKYYEIYQIKTYPKTHNNIKFNYNVSENNDTNRQIKNIFQQFFIFFIYKKLDTYIEFYNTDIILQCNNKLIISDIIQQFSDFKLEAQKIRGRFFILNIIYSSKELSNNLRNKDNIYYDIITNIMENQNSYSNIMFFYIFPSFLNWINSKNIEMCDVEKWNIFFTFNQIH